MLVPESWKDIFEPDLWHEMEELGERKIIKPHEKVVEAGKYVRISFIVISGTLKVSRLDDTGRELLLYYLHKDESCAMTFTCCMQTFPSEVNVTAEEETEYAALPIAQMDSWMMKYSSWKSFVMNTIRGRFNELLLSIDQIVFQKLDERLVNYLKTKSKVLGSNIINISHEQIAADLASSREVISRLLKKLENDNKVKLSRKQIQLLNGF